MRYDPLKGINDTFPSKKKTRTYRLRKKMRELYKKNATMKVKASSLYTTLAAMEVSKGIIQQLRSVYDSRHLSEGIKSG